MKTFLVGGARPNFMKIAAISRAYEKYKMDYDIIHTGQHYDYNMSNIFFKQLGLKDPKYHLNVGTELNQGAQTGRIMEKFEEICIKERPDLVYTVGDVNSSMAASIVAAKLKIPSAHQESGCREFDRKIPEEVNRMVSDILSDYLFTVSLEDHDNLVKEGIDAKRITPVGDVMIDNLLYYSQKATCQPPTNFCLVTLHRPENVDNEENLRKIFRAISYISSFTRVVFPMHPRTRKMTEKFCLWKYMENIDVLDPLGYFDFLCYLKYADFVITDSDGIQVETSVLNIPCITPKRSTNFNFTVEQGTNTLVGNNELRIIELACEYHTGNAKVSEFDDNFKTLLDGKAAERSVAMLGISFGVI